MNTITDRIDINNFVVLIEQSNAQEAFLQTCALDGDAIGFSFYGSGNVELEINYDAKTKVMTNTNGIAISFFGNDKVKFVHTITPHKPLQSITVFTRMSCLNALPEKERTIFYDYLPQLTHPKANFVEGPCFYMTPDMQQAVQKIFATSYTGSTRLLFLKSQVNELLAHFFAVISSQKTSCITLADREKLFQAKAILTQNISQPPSLNELSRRIGVNSSKLKKEFKELFGLPVFKYLQEERLNKAYEMLSNSQVGVQEAAWSVGYESLSSFSNAFLQKFGARPNEIKQQFLSNKS